MEFTKKFDNYACPGETITTEVRGYTVTARIERDDDYTPPWEECDGHGPVSGWATRDKKPGERVLIRDGRSRRYYDFQEAVAIARRDGWDAPPFKEGTKGQQAVRAVEADFQSLKAWCNNDWWYCGIVLSVERDGEEVDDHFSSVWRIEANHPNGDSNGYLTDTANELLNEFFRSAESRIMPFCSAVMK